MSENKNIIICPTCGEEIAKSAKVCPKCGARMKKPWYKKWWVWVIAVVAIGSIYGSGSKDKSKSTATSEQLNAVSETAAPAEIPETEEIATVVETEAPTEASAPAEAPAPTQTPAPAENNVSESSQPTQELVDGMRPEFKEALDSYEAFFDEYCKFMKKYKENPGDMELLSDYADFMKKYTETMQKMEALDDGDLNDAELKYYLQVTNRINEKLIEVAL